MLHKDGVREEIKGKTNTVNIAEEEREEEEEEINGTTRC